MLTSHVKQPQKNKNKTSKVIIDRNPNNSYKTKKNFTGSYTEVNPYKGSKKVSWLNLRYKTQKDT